MRICKLLLAMHLGLVQAVLQATATANIPEADASYYADSLHGSETASGASHDMNALSATHRSLPFGAKAKVTYEETGQSVEVVINDRGPYAKGRIIDISGAAANESV